MDAALTFHNAAVADSLAPGQGRTVHVQGREFSLWNEGGEFFCLDDECPHVGGPLGAGWFEGGKVFCPLHGWGFDVRTGNCTTGPQCAVRTHPTRVVDGQVQIGL